MFQSLKIIAFSGLRLKVSYSEAVKHLAVPTYGGAFRASFPPVLPNTATCGGRAPLIAGRGVFFVILMFWSIGPFPQKVGVGEGFLG